MRKSVLKNKKGNAVLDTILVVGILFAIAIVAVVSYYVHGIFNDLIQDSNFSNTSKAYSQQGYDRFPNIVDGTYVFIFILLWAMVIVASFSIDSHPIFFIFTTILLIFVIIVGAILANFFSDWTQDPNLAASISHFPKINWIMNNFVMIIIFIGLSISLALYSKLRS